MCEDPREKETGFPNSPLRTVKLRLFKPVNGPCGKVPARFPLPLLFFLRVPFRFLPVKSSSAVFRCPVHGSIKVSSDELKVIDHPFFQRLRHVSQLGFAHYVFPGSTHNRFSHGLGAMHLAGRVFERMKHDGFPPLKRLLNENELKRLERVFRFAALLHDLGHAPFSHACDNLFGDVEQLPFPVVLSPRSERKATHEDYSIGMILAMGERPDVPFDLDEARDIVALIGGDPSFSPFFKDRGKGVFRVFKHLIGSEIDVDRMDYLLRDAYHTGTAYGRFDLHHLLRSLCSITEEGSTRLLLDNNAITTYENFILARSHMFTQVYCHKTLRSFNRYVELASAEKEIEGRVPTDLEEFAQTGEHLLMAQILNRSEKKWCGKIVRREPLKLIKRRIQPTPEERTEMEGIFAVLTAKGISPIYDRKRFVYSNQIGLRADHPEAILVFDDGMGKFDKESIGVRSHLLRALPSLLRVHTLSCFREDAERVFSILEEG